MKKRMQMSFGSVEKVLLQDHNDELHDITDMEPEDYIKFLEHMAALKVAHDVLFAEKKG